MINPALRPHFSLLYVVLSVEEKKIFYTFTLRNVPRSETAQKSSPLGWYNYT